MATYRMVYGDSELVVRETFEKIDNLHREDGWGHAVPRQRRDSSRSGKHAPSLEEVNG